MKLFSAEEMAPVRDGPSKYVTMPVPVCVSSVMESWMLSWAKASLYTDEKVLTHYLATNCISIWGI